MVWEGVQDHIRCQLLGGAENGENYGATQCFHVAAPVQDKIGVLTEHSIAKPDNPGSRTASTVQITKARFARLLLRWRKSRGLALGDAASILCCAPSTLWQWERKCRLPQAFTLRSIVSLLEGGIL